MSRRDTKPFTAVQICSRPQRGKEIVCLPSGDVPQGHKTLMKFYTYILRSLKNGNIYIGSTENVQNRLQRHNKGKVKSTKGYKPWQLMEFIEFNSRNEAVRYERFLKTGQQKEIIRKKYGLVAEKLGVGLQNPLQQCKSAPDLKGGKEIVCLPSGDVP
ncbi:MAG: GIY-YIG nuclease family protein [Candidatus Moranbacteria bacterium]|nr:GIY-YIG nuclease family protein [Candidatus Moranbacteria bacterium]